MSLFKATFSTFFEGSLEGLTDIEDSSNANFFFEAQDIKCAKKIAQAMLGQKVCESEDLEILHRVLDVSLNARGRTRKNFKHCFLRNKNNLWWGVFRKLNSTGEKVRILIDSNEDPFGIQFL